MIPEFLSGAARAVRHVFKPYPATDIPEGQMLDLPGRGRAYVTDSGPRDAPAVFLLHSVLTTGLLCWYPTIPAINDRYRVITLDARWHGRGIESENFDLRDCADDVAAVADVLGIDRFVAAGFSMGGGIAQLVWRRHPERVSGLVLCSTGPFFSTSDPRHQRSSQRTGRILAPLYRMLPRISDKSLDKTTSHTSVWALRQFFSTPLSHLGEFGNGLGRFDSRGWLDEIDVPTAVVVSTRDRVVEPERQQLLLDGIPGSQRFEVDGGHACCVLGARFFIPPFTDALDAVTADAAVRPSTRR
ncbi:MULTISPECIES: alpha/beta fold hydrolase [Gordonia]|uniref:Alpha/beta fold hydrolase n=1 Tax=Gordonia amicalis TaxID=89053 RepID=A0AAE4R7B8_9ACTN|nr:MULTISPECIES: alpha/beta fold hydrolase [Gordonia]MCZ4579386.1 alpha/beta fold hydrolase [Gordonia amicalis]MCZ4653264.1 alpha/beta fold hydrolase [Gordonia amicalis]MDJ0454193.1 alpha/beta fold hydrolase [Gordonia amicalis]MDV6307586.1 alpha/beta fold hydrolase [Gordonia amicalis]MDV6313432.1 alpha/beta fold hydrolase [Gordonia amicalis]